MAREDPETFLRALMTSRRGELLPDVPFSRDAVANAFVMLGLLPEPRAEEILAEYRLELEAKGFRIGLRTGELTIRPGAHGFQEARAAGRDDLTGIPLAVAADPVHSALDGVNLSVIQATLTPGGVRLHFRVVGNGHPYPEGPGQQLDEVIRTGLSLTDDTGQRYRLRLVSGRGTVASRGRSRQSWEGEMLAEPEPRAAGPLTAETVRWLEFATASGPPARVVMPPPARIPAGAAEPPWPTPAECYLASLAPVTSMSIGSENGTVELDTAQIVAAVAEALLRVGALPPGSALLSAGTAGTAADGRRPGWQESLMYLWVQHAHERARDGEPDRAGLAAGLPLRQATAVIESITAHDDLVSIELYGHPWEMNEYWPMIAPCFQVRAVDDTGVEHEGLRGSGGGSPEGIFEFSFWPPIPLAAKQIRVTVSTLWEAAWADLDIPGRCA